MNKENLIVKYEKKLSTVELMWKEHGERGQEYIDFAKGELEAVKENGIDGLKEYWSKSKC
jgi:hypothetical protein